MAKQEDVSFEIKIPGLTPLPNQKMHWARKAKEAKKWREITFWACRSQLKHPFQTLHSVRLKLVRASAVCPDLDNLIASFKNIIDGLKDAKVIADDNPRIVKQIIPLWEYAIKNKGFMKIIIEPME